MFVLVVSAAVKEGSAADMFGYQIKKVCSKYFYVYFVVVKGLIALQMRHFAKQRRQGKTIMF